MQLKCQDMLQQHLYSPGGRGTFSQRPLSGELSLKICRAASTNYLSTTSLWRPTFFGSTSALSSFHLLSGTYTPRLCASHTLATKQTIRAVVQRHPHLLLPWAWAWPCNSLRGGRGVQQRHAGLSLLQKLHIPLATTPRICGPGRSASEQHGIPQPPDQSACHPALSARMTCQ